MLPRRFQRGKSSLLVARLTAFLFIITTLIIAMNASRFGGVLSLLIIWFGGLVGPISIPMLLGLLPAFRRSGSAAALVSWAVGVGTFFCVKFIFTDVSTATQVAAPVMSSLVLFVVMGWLRRAPVRPEARRAAHSTQSGSEYDCQFALAAESQRFSGGIGMTLLQQGKRDRLWVKRFAHRDALGAAAAQDCIAHLQQLLQQQAVVRMVFAAAPSQREFLAALVAAPHLDWQRIHAFHMDEYIGLDEGAAAIQSFSA